MTGREPAAGPRDPSTFVVTGGASFKVNVEALNGSVAALAAAEAALGDVRVRLEAARSAVWRGACAGSGPAASFDADAADLVRRASLEALGASSARRGVSDAAAGYVRAEARTASAAGARPQGLRWLVRGLSPSDEWTIRGGGPVRDEASVLRLLMGDLSKAPLIPWVVAGGPADRIGVVRSQVVAGRQDASTFAYAGRSLQQAQGSAMLDDGTAVPPSSILVERVPRPDGTTAVMVTVPGTQTWDADDPAGGVFDAEGNLDAMAGPESHARQLIERALADQELRSGDSVVFNVYSQGSLHVFGLLEDEGFRSRYPVEAVTVLGGVPTAFRVPDDVAVLSVANHDDIVPALSGLPPAPRPNVVDVRTPASSDDGDEGLLAAVANAHSIDRYAADAQALDGSTDPAVRGYAAILGAAVGTGIVGAAGAARRERFVYTGSDTSVPDMAGSRAGSAPSRSSAVPRPTPSPLRPPTR